MTPTDRRRDNERDTAISHPNNEHFASREHDLTQTGLEYNSQDAPVIVVQSVNAIKGSSKRLRIPVIPYNIHLVNTPLGLDLGEVCSGMNPIPQHGESVHR